MVSKCARCKKYKTCGEEMPAKGSDECVFLCAGCLVILRGKLAVKNGEPLLPIDPAKIKCREVYRHKGGGIYVVDAIAERVEEEGGERIIVYRNLETGKQWSQSVARFCDPGRFAKCEAWKPRPPRRRGAGEAGGNGAGFCYHLEENQCVN
jgi:hypothetical protein